MFESWGKIENICWTSLLKAARKWCNVNEICSFDTIQLALPGARGRFAGGTGAVSLVGAPKGIGGERAPEQGSVSKGDSLFPGWNTAQRPPRSRGLCGGNPGVPHPAGGRTAAPGAAAPVSRTSGFPTPKSTPGNGNPDWGSIEKDGKAKIPFSSSAIYKTFQHLEQGTLVLIISVW